MRSLVAWFGAQPKPTCNKIQVYSKLGGTFLGAIQRPCLKEVDAYSVLREFQDQVATWLCHPKMPSRYLVLFVGTLRLTSTDFPFVDQVDAKSSQQVFGALGKALRIDAMWDDGIECAKSRLASKGFRVLVSGHRLSLYKMNNIHDIQRKDVLPMEVEAFTFRDTIRDVWVNCGAQRLGCIHVFPHVEELGLGGWLQEVDFKRLAQIATLTDLNIRTTCLTKDVGFMTSLKALSVETSNVGCIPTTIGLLTRLTNLWLLGAFAQTIPSEVGNLVELSALTIKSTNVSGSIPSEVCKLTRLTNLDLSWNPHLEGALPEEFCNLGLLSNFCLYNTPVEAKDFLKGWQLNRGVSRWTREV